MEIHQLQLLRELGELGSVTAVADTLFVTPSAVSQQLSQLQRSVGVPLTRKQGRTLVLTNAGRALAEAGGRVVQAMAQAEAAISEHLEAPNGTVTVCAFHSAGQTLYGPLIAAVRAAGGPELLLTDEDVAEHDFPALTGRYDLVLAHRMSHSGQWQSSNITATTLAEEPFDVALPAGHPLAAKLSLQPKDVIDEPWATSRAGYSPDDVLGGISMLAGTSPRVAHRVNDYTTVAAIVAGGGVLGLLPRHLATSALPSGVVLRPLEGITTRRKIDLLSRPENLARRSVRMVAEVLQDLLTELTQNGTRPAGP
ncbi:DNA-binding transcriptional LysR family regulator [Psychromicrobium silvestre]|uniref:DNA-binding transcriptional LysR family regulator n=1 Tax=Psychromicrobium silvestre TaxID=1645614 RepID=A0A7Y9S6F4_9MICC|nr:LysR family transcriptional regulator [Psychromicrobium silvestre]NYE94970.1 DNA-binding transcriptional LysR family regulator [Psychromicrobium silvestre]